MLLAFAAPPLDQLADQSRQRAKLKREFQIAVRLLGDDLEGIDAHLLLEPRQDRVPKIDLSTISSVNSLVSLDRLTASPRAAGAAQRSRVFLVDFADQGAELIDDAPMKGGLHHAPLPAPEIALRWS